MPQARNVGTIRLLTRFLRLLLPVFLLATSVGLYLISAITFGDERNTIVTRVGSLAARTASAINRLPDEATRTHQDSILNLLLADPAVSCAVILDANKKMISSAPARIGCKGMDLESSTEIKLTRPAGSILCVKYNLTELEERSYLFRIFTLLALFGSLLVAGASSWFSFRTVVGKPVHALLEAIRITNKLGEPTKVDEAPNDELGTVIIAFNAMQDKLQAEARRNAEALRRLDYIYNETPALMFSLDGNGIIRTVSGHWFDETGYRREEIVGKPLRSFLDRGNELSFAAARDTILKAQRPLRDMPFTLLCKDEHKKDVLLAVVPDNENVDASKLCVLSDISGLKAAQTELRRQALTDHLTGLPNRQGLFEHLSSFEAGGMKSTPSSALLFVDLDNFKNVNDTLGHDSGDVLLKAAAGRLKNCISKRDLLARLGGDEFAIVLHDLRQPTDAQRVAERILKSFLNPFRLGEAQAMIGTSIGIASFADSENTDDILRLADLAMYQSKQSGKNCFSCYTNDLTAKVISRDTTVRKIRDALANNHFVYYLQPIVDMQTLKPMGAEALLRLNCPNDGLMSPAEIIKVAEETGLIGQITAWGVAEGLALSARAQKNLSDKGRYISINLSPKQITRDFITELVGRLRANPKHAQSMLFEITETALFRQDEDVSGILQELRTTGARIALDDFGTGYSSLGHLHRFPVDLIKLDRSFVQGLGTENEDSRRRRALIKATAAMASELSMAIVAEGVEDEATLMILRQLSIAYGQGYYFSPPLPESAAFSWMDAFEGNAAPESKIVRLAR